MICKVWIYYFKRRKATIQMKNSIKFNTDGSVEFTSKKPNIKIIKPNKKGEYIGSYEI